MRLNCVLCDFFFFQAEDGIRDLTVTGVQTCALPIWRSHSELRWMWPWPTFYRSTCGAGENERSEERRVGKSVDLGGRRIIKKKKKKKKTKVNKLKKKKRNIKKKDYSI